MTCTACSWVPCICVDPVAREKCHRGSCSNAHDWWWNSSTERYYCQPCAIKINEWSPGLCIRLTPKSERPLP